MIRTLFFIFFSLQAFANQLGLKNVTPEDQVLINQHIQTLMQVKEKLTPEQFQQLYDSGNMVKLLKTNPDSYQSHGSTFDRVVNPQVIENIKNNPYRGQDPEVVIQMIEERARGTRLEKIFQKMPRMKVFMAHWMTHEDALPRFVRILGKKKQLMNIGIFFIIIFLIMVYITEKWTERENLIFVRMFKRWLGRVASLWMCVGLFYFVFRQDLGPTWQLVKKYLIFKGS